MGKGNGCPPFARDRAASGISRGRKSMPLVSDALAVGASDAAFVSSNRRVIVRLGRLGILEGRHDLLLGHPCAVIAFDQQGDAAAVIDMPRPTHGLVEEDELLVQVTILLHRRDGLRATRAGINAINHSRTPSAS